MSNLPKYLARTGNRLLCAKYCSINDMPTRSGRTCLVNYDYSVHSVLNLSVVIPERLHTMLFDVLKLENRGCGDDRENIFVPYRLQDTANKT